MYFPYIRGRQFELLALKELGAKGLISDKIIPVVEPVKLSSTLINTVNEYIKTQRKIALIINPSVGNFLSECRKVEENSKEEKMVNTFQGFFSSEFVIPSLIMNLDTKKHIKKYHPSDCLIVNIDQDFLDDYTTLFSNTPPLYTLSPDTRVFRRSVYGDEVIFEDRFNKRIRNADYAKKPDEQFSDDHLYFSKDGYIGFSDYSIIGNEYTESGFAPYAVAIHIVHFDKSNKLRVKHFVSDSNDDIDNPAGKFYEALTKLNTWYQKEPKQPQTEGLATFLEYYTNQTYPGLGTVKKLSLMHHLELMSQHL